jgi:methyl-accepting chemotaxis protein
MLDPEEAYYKLLEVYGQNVIASKTDLKGNIVYVSDAFCQISGYSRRELMGQPHSIIRHPDTPSSLFKELWNTIKNSKTFKAQIKNKKKDGSFYWVDMTVSPILDEFNNIVGYTAIRHDITTQKELEELNFEHQKLIDSFSKNVIASKTDLKGNITYVSDAFCKVSGYSKNELLGKAHNIVRHPDMSKTFYKQLWQKIKSGEEFKGIIKNKNKKGEAYWVNVAITCDYDKDNKHIGYTSIRTDITKQKELEEKLEELTLKKKED